MADNLQLSYVPPTRSTPGRRREQHTNNNNISGITFLQNTVAIPGINDILHLDIKCYNCNVPGHYAGNCPQHTNRNKLTMLQVNATATSINDKEAFAPSA